MNSIEQDFLSKTYEILNDGYQKTPQRVNCNNKVVSCSSTKMLPHVYLSHKMSDGFPLFTHRKMPFKSACVELEGFIKGIISKRWYQERGCRYWDHWSNPYGQEDDLGAIYPHSWRNFGQSLDDGDNGVKVGADQLYYIVQELRRAPLSRRGVVINWNPLQLERAALPACHIAFVVNTSGIGGNTLNLCFFQRSCDFPRGHNIHTYGLLLELLAKELQKEAGMLSVMYADCHIYENDWEICEELCNSPIKQLPLVKIPNVLKSGKPFSIFDWTYEDIELIGYNPGPSVKFGEIEV